MPGQLFGSGIFSNAYNEGSFLPRKMATAQLLVTVEPKSILGVGAMKLPKHSLVSVEILTQLNREGFTFKVKAAVPLALLVLIISAVADSWFS